MIILTNILTPTYIPYYAHTMYIDRKIDSEYSGTTLTCAVIRGQTCILANIGDCGTALAFKE